MSSLRPNFLFVAFSSLAAVLLMTLLIRHPGNPVPEKTSSAHGLRAPGPSAPKQERIAREYRDHYPTLVPRWSPHLRSLEAAPSELEALQETNPFSWEKVREDLSFVIKEKFPDLQLSKREFFELTEAIQTIQFSMNEMREAERTKSNAEALRGARSQLYQAVETFAEITKMDLAEFILRGRPESGIDLEDSEEDEGIQEYLTDFEP